MWSQPTGTLGWRASAGYQAPQQLKGVELSSSPKNPLKGISDRLTPTHIAALTAAVVLTVWSAIAAGLGWWTGAILGIAALLMLLLAVNIIGFNNVSRRVNNQARTQTRKALTVPPEQRNLRVGDAVGSISYWVAQVRKVRGQLSWFTTLAIQNRLDGARDVLSYASTNGQHDFKELGGLLESARIPLYREDVDQQLTKVLWKPGMISLARVLYSQRTSEMDLLDALTIYELLRRIDGDSSVKGTDRSYYADLLVWKGRHDEALNALASGPETTPDRAYSQGFLRLNAINPNVTGNPKRRYEWLESLNDLLAESGLAPVTVKNPEAPSFFDLECDVPAADVPGAPLVSVIMPIYEPDESTDLAIRSLLNQTWTNLEIIVLDDASPAVDADGNPTDFRSRLQAWEGVDDRLRIVFCDENRGAYAVRNDGYDLARGEYVTIADKDDWHHPQKIELQATELMQNPDIPANLGNWVRVSEDLEFLLRWGPDRIVHPSFASLMYRREEILQTLGYWDTVRKSGDGEFKFRFQLVYGVDLQPRIKAPLAFSLMGTGNLTSADLGLGYRNDDRHAYQRSYRAWHQQISAGTVPPYMPKHPEVRPFWAPQSFLPAKSTETPSYDVVFMSEFGFEAGNSTILREEIEACLTGGLTVGVIPVQNGLIASASRRHFTPQIEQMIFDGRIDRLALDRPAQVKTLIIRWPASLQLNPGVSSALSAEDILVIANHMPYEVGGGRRSYDIRTVSDNVERTFGQRPVWSPESERVLHYLQDLVPPGELAPFTWKGIIKPLDHQAIASSTAVVTSRRPVIGRHARDDAGKWPSTQKQFRQVYPVDGSVRVTILGGANYPAKVKFLPEEQPESWTVYGFNTIEVSEYLNELDFFVYYHSDDLVEAFGMAILEAMNHGVVCVLPPHFKPVFGDAAVYAEPQQVAQTIDSLWEPGRYAAQQQRGFEFVHAECSPAAYLRRLERLGTTSDAPALTPTATQ